MILVRNRPEVKPSRRTPRPVAAPFGEGLLPATEAHTPRSAAEDGFDVRGRRHRVQPAPQPSRTVRRAPFTAEDLAWAAATNPLNSETEDARWDRLAEEALAAARLDMGLCL